MNKIYIIDFSFHFEINLDFRTNTFEKDNINYKFDITSKNTIEIYWSDKMSIYYTNDSYLYYLENDNNLKNKIKKIFLVNNEWFDQVVLNIETSELNRINYNQEKGNFKFDDNLLKIDWKNWGIETFVKYDEFTYIKESYHSNYYFEKNDNKINNLVPIHIFIHITLINDWKEIFIDILDNIKKSGLYELVTKIHLGILGNIDLIYDDIFKDDKINIIYIDQRTTLYEIQTINYIKYFCNESDKELYILYIHTKGVRNVGNKDVTKSWRKMMEFFLINHYKKCLNYLNDFDTIGNNIVNSYCSENVNINKDHTYHYSGNFWWSKKSYIDKLDFLPLDLTNNSINTRYRAENWILSKYPDAKVGIAFQDDTNTHPYHRYVFEYYEKMNFLIKKL